MRAITPRPATFETDEQFPPPPATRLLATLLFLLGAGTAAAALLGPLVTGVIEYHVSEGARDQVIGGDVAVLALVAPTSLAAGIFVMRRNRAGVALALGPSVYGSDEPDWPSGGGADRSTK